MTGVVRSCSRGLRQVFLTFSAAAMVCVCDRPIASAVHVWLHVAVTQMHLHLRRRGSTGAGRSVKAG